MDVSESCRPGALIAGTWAAMQYMGEKYVTLWSPTPIQLIPIYHHFSGYHQSAKNIVTATRKIIHGIKTEIPELYVLGNPPTSVVACGVKEGSGINIMRVGDTMSKKGWGLSALQNPPALHISVTVRNLYPPTLPFFF